MHRNIKLTVTAPNCLSVLCCFLVSKAVNNSFSCDRFQDGKKELEYHNIPQ